MTCQPWNATIATMIQPQELLQELGPETWGDKLQRARRSRGLSLDQVAAIVSEIVPVSYGPFQRLERLAESPEGRKTRMWAVVMLLICAYHPEEFGLSMEDVPAPIRDAAMARNVLVRPPDRGGEQQGGQSRCTGRTLAPVLHLGERLELSAATFQPSLEPARRVA